MHAADDSDIKTDWDIVVPSCAAFMYYIQFYFGSSNKCHADQNTKCPHTTEFTERLVAHGTLTLRQVVHTTSSAHTLMLGTAYTVCVQTCQRIL